VTVAALNAKLPPFVRVGPYDMTLAPTSGVKTFARRSVGEFSARELKISYAVEAPSKIDALDTLLHEINHAIFFAYRIYDEDKEERTVGMFATAWTQVYRDNPWLLEWIREATVTDPPSGYQHIRLTPHHAGGRGGAD
jgi:hypothetical protein